MRKPLVLLLLALVATTLLATGYALATAPLLTNTMFSGHTEVDHTQVLSSQQGITGGVTIANVSPVCSVTGSVPSIGPDLVVASSTGRIQIVSLGWILHDQCELISRFHVTLDPATYSLSLSSCSYMGCRILPITAVVVPGVFTPVKINIATGIY